MANMMDYLDWRGDLTFQQAPFNEVDNLLLTELVYVDFTGIVPAPGFNGAVFLKDASRLFWERHTDQLCHGRPESVRGVQRNGQYDCRLAGKF